MFRSGSLGVASDWARVAGREQLHHPPSLDKIKFVIEKGSLGTLSRPGGPRSKHQPQADKKILRYRAAVSLQLDDVFPGKRIGCRIVNYDPGIDEVAFCVRKICNRGHPRRRYYSGYFATNFCRLRAGQPDYSDPAPARRGRYRDDCIRGLIQ